MLNCKLNKITFLELTAIAEDYSRKSQILVRRMSSQKGLLEIFSAKQKKRKLSILMSFCGVSYIVGFTKYSSLAKSCRGLMIADLITIS